MNPASQFDDPPLRRPSALIFARANSLLSDSSQNFASRVAASAGVLALCALAVLIPAHVVHAKSGAHPNIPAITVRPPLQPKYELRLHHLHTGESLDVVYRVGDEYIPEAMAQLNHFLRDHRTQDVSSYDPREFDLLHSLMAKLGKPKGEIDVVCGYRTPWSNNFLRTQGPDTGVAEHSQHMEAKAIDIRVPGVTTKRLDVAALSLHGGGVGYYPRSQFVHVDVGPVREWSFGGGSRRRKKVHRG
jgi:uncharacterized protein YcbK (DUF882 family)